MRTAAFQRLMSRLALLAVLLMALMPTAGRLVAAQASPGSTAAGWAELCTTEGLKRVSLASLPSTPALQSPASSPDANSGGLPGPHHGSGGEDCAYCPLLQATVAAAPLLLALSAAAPLSAPDDRSAHAPLLAVAWRGLGSQGPPLTL